MTAFALTDAYIVVNAVDMSEWTRSVTLPFEAEELETTTMGQGGWRSRIAGLKDGSMDLELINDYDAAAVDSLLWPLFGTVVTVAIRPTSAAISATNPEYSGTALVNQINPLDGSVGDLAVRSISWPSAGAWTRATA
jgi:predicted secreted protein